MRNDPPAPRTSEGRFQKGVSGNPSGDSKAFAEVRKMLTAAVPGAAQRMVDLMEHADPKVALAATKDILDRTLGKAKESKDIKIEGNALFAQLLSEIAAERKAGKIDDDDDDDSEP